jgi:putative transposase
LAERIKRPEVPKALNVFEQTCHRLRARFDGVKVDDVKRLQELERENARLMRLVADEELENLALQEISTELVSPSRRRSALAHRRSGLLRQ